MVNGENMKKQINKILDLLENQMIKDVKTEGAIAGQISFKLSKHIKYKWMQITDDFHLMVTDCENKYHKKPLIYDDRDQIVQIIENAVRDTQIDLWEVERWLMKKTI